VLNPEAGVGHITQTVVRDIELDTHPWSAMPGPPLRSACKRPPPDAKGLLGDIRQLARPRWLGARNPRGSNRFVGRLDELWQVHSALDRRALCHCLGLAQPWRGTAAGQCAGQWRYGEIAAGGGIRAALWRLLARWPCLDRCAGDERPARRRPLTPWRSAAKPFTWSSWVWWPLALGIDGNQAHRGLEPAAIARRVGSTSCKKSGQRLPLAGGRPANLQPRRARRLAGPQCQRRHPVHQPRTPAPEPWAPTSPWASCCPMTPTRLLCKGRKPHDACRRSRGPQHRSSAWAGTRWRWTRRAPPANRQGFTEFLKRLDQNDQQALALSKNTCGRPAQRP
jgi:hypothetical protein